MKQAKLNIQTKRKHFEHKRKISELVNAGMTHAGATIHALDEPKRGTRRKTKSKILKVILETARDMHRLGFIDDQRIKEYEETCL